MGHAPSRGLDGETRSQGCVHDCFSPGMLQKSTPFLLEWQELAVQLYALWTVVATLVLHQVAKASGRMPLFLRGPSDRLSRQFTPHGTGREDAPDPCPVDSEAFSILGLLVNWEKLILPSTIMEFLGFAVDSITVSCSLPPLKVCAIHKEIRRALERPRITLRHLVQVIGLLTTSIQAIFPITLHYCALRHLKLAYLHRGMSYVTESPWTRRPAMNSGGESAI